MAMGSTWQKQKMEKKRANELRHAKGGNKRYSPSSLATIESQGKWYDAVHEVWREVIPATDEKSDRRDGGRARLELNHEMLPALPLGVIAARSDVVVKRFQAGKAEGIRVTGKERREAFTACGGDGRRLNTHGVIAWAATPKVWPLYTKG